MPTLNEYIGSLVSSITSARVISDIKSVDVAKQYAGHDLLKYYSIPRMRIEDVEMEIPVAMAPRRERQRQVTKVTIDPKINSRVYLMLLKKLGITKALPREEATAIRNRIIGSTKTLKTKLTADGNVAKHLKELINAVISVASTQRTVRTSITQNNINLDTVRSQMLAELQPFVQVESEESLGELDILFEAHHLKEVDPNALCKIKINISEEGMVWERIEHPNGETENKLLPE